MNWVRKTEPAPEGGHKCVPPMRDVTYVVGDPDDIDNPTWTHVVPDGAWDDLWRCDDCGELWRVGNDCDRCDPRYPGGDCKPGWFHSTGFAWRPATLWQRIRHRKTGAK